MSTRIEMAASKAMSGKGWAMAERETAEFIGFRDSCTASIAAGTRV
jgi:hypothetical protein